MDSAPEEEALEEEAPEEVAPEEEAPEEVAPEEEAPEEEAPEEEAPEEEAPEEEVDCKRMYMHLDILFLRQRNILHQSSYCFYRLHILDCHCNIPHYPVSIKSGMY